MARSKIEVILLSNFDLKKLKGNLGEIAQVKRGYAKNFLIPNQMVLYANNANKKKFEELKAQTMQKAEALKNKAMLIAEKINNLEITIKAQSGQDGKIFGSVSSKDIIEHINQLDQTIEINKNQISISSPIKYTGQYSVRFNLNPDVSIEKNINIISGSISNNINNEQDDMPVAGYNYSASINSEDKKYDRDAGDE